MKKTANVVVVLCLFAGGALAQTSGLLISEYVDGTLFNKAIEIYNGTENTVYINDYTVVVCFDNVIPFTIGLGPALLDPEDVCVVADKRAEAGLRALADQLVSALSFAGNEAILLATSSGGLVVPSPGQRLLYPGDGWSCASSSTVSHTLRRLPRIGAGDANLDDGFDPCLQWAFYPVDTFDGMGMHVANCPGVDVDHGSWGPLKACYR